MTTYRTRLALAGTGALALVMAVAGIAGAQGTDQGGATNGFGLGVGQGADAQGQARGMGGEMGGHHGGHGGPGDMDGDHGKGGGPLDPFMDGSTIVRQETVIELADGTFATRRLEHGTVTVAAADAITFTLATGETVTVTVDADTVVEEAPAFAGGRGGPNGDAFGRGWESARPNRDGGPAVAPAPVDPASIAVGATVMVASEAQADGSWLAHEIHLLPAFATEVPAPDASAAPVSNG